MPKKKKHAFNTIDDDDDSDVDHTSDVNDDEHDEAPAADDEKFDIEKILTRRRVRPRLANGAHWEYHVKWHGYPSSCNTWEPDYNLSVDVPDLLDAFIADLQRPTSKKKRTAERRRSSDLSKVNNTEKHQTSPAVEKLKKRQRRRGDQSIAPSSTKRANPYDVAAFNTYRSFGIERGMTVDKIWGVTPSGNGGAAVLVTWQGSDDVDLVPFAFLQRYYPRVLFRYVTENRMLRVASPT